MLLRNALVAAYARLTVGETGISADPVVALAWVRAPDAIHTEFLVGGPLGGRPANSQRPAEGEPSGLSGPTPVLYPPGALGVPVVTRDALALFDRFPCWLRCPGHLDAALAGATLSGLSGISGATGGASATDIAGRSSFDDFVAHLGRPFCWLVVAEPRNSYELERDIKNHAERLSSMLLNGEQHRDPHDFATTEARYRELRRSRVTGDWWVHMLVGATSANEAREVAAILCCAADVSLAGFELLPGRGEPAALESAWANRATGFEEGFDDRLEDGVPDSPFVATPELLAALARPPSRELPGIRAVTPGGFDVTPEADPLGAGPDAPAYTLGTVLDDAYEPAGDLVVAGSTLNRHAFVCGATGAGKTKTVQLLLESLSGGAAPEAVQAPAAGATRGSGPVHWLVVESAKAEYAGMSGRLGAGGSPVVIRPGASNLSVPPVSINPLEPEKDFPLQSHADFVQALFLAAFEAEDPFPQILSAALTACYEEAGLDMVTGKPHPPHKPKLYAGERTRDVRTRYPTLEDLRACARKVVDDQKYGREVAANMQGFVKVRIGSLQNGTPGRFFQDGHPLDIGELLSRNVVLELEDVTNDQDKAFLIGVLLIRIVEYLRLRHLDEKRRGVRVRKGFELKHVTVVEEAHRLLKNVREGPAAQAVSLFAALLAEIRAYGEGVVVVEQIPSKISPDVVKNTALKVMHRLPAADDRLLVGAAMNLQEDQSEAVVALRPGVAAVAADGMDRPVLVTMARPERGRAAPLAGPPPSPVEPAPPLIRCGRSILCSGMCPSTPCSLARVNTAKKAAGEPEVVLWVEAVVTAHLMAVPVPVLRPRYRDGLVGKVGKDSQTLRCAITYAVERAVAARREHLRPYVDADDLMRQVRNVLHPQVGLPAEPPVPDDPDDLADPADGGGPGGAVAGVVAGSAGQPGLRWRAGPYRFSDIRKTLAAAEDADQAKFPGAHPDTPSWARRGLFLDGRTVREQYLELVEHRSSSPDGWRAVYGDPEVSGFVDAVGRLTGRASRDRLLVALRQVCTGPAVKKLVEPLERLFPRPKQPEEPVMPPKAPHEEKNHARRP